MEGQGTGGPNLEPRVRQLEHQYEVLHADVGQVKSSLAVMSQQIADGFAKIGDNLSEFRRRQQRAEDQLDAHRTKRPELGALAGVAALILAVGGATLWPLNQRQGMLESDITHLEAEISQLQKESVTKEDAQRLEDKIDRLLLK